VPDGLSAWDQLVRIRDVADIRFPIERANGVRTMETCHALAPIEALDEDLQSRGGRHA
jgi:hypothetical protein